MTILLVLNFSLLALSQTSSIWIPPNTPVIRGALLNYVDNLPSGAPDSPTQELLKTWKFGYIYVARGSSFSVGELQGLAQRSGHPEVANIGLCPVGMSWSAGQAWEITNIMPQRVIAAAVVCISNAGNITDTNRLKTPIVFIAGEGDFVETTVRIAFENRRNGAQWCAAIRWNVFHAFGTSKQFIYPFFDQCIRHRIPDDWDPLSGPVKLKNFKEEDGWLGFRDKSYKSSFPKIAPVKSYTGDLNNSMWFPNEYIATLWRSFHLYHDGLLDSNGNYLATANSPTFELLGPATTFNELSLTNSGNYQIVGNYSGSKPVSRIEYYDGNILLGSPKGKFSLLNVNLARGAHGIYGIAHFQDGTRMLTPLGSILSTGGSMDVKITQPTQFDRLKTGVPLNIQAIALVNSGTVKGVDFYINDTLLGSTSTAPYTTQWTPPHEGTFVLKAKIRSDKDSLFTGWPVKVTVVNASVPTSLQVNPSKVDLRPGDTISLNALVRDQNGVPLNPQPMISFSPQGGTMQGKTFTAGQNKGEFVVTVSASGLSQQVKVRISPTIRINFQAPWAFTPDGFLPDVGDGFKARSNGLSYGWTQIPARNIFIRPADGSIGAEYATFIPMDVQRDPPWAKTIVTGIWEIAVPNGEYTVHCVAGDLDNVYLDIVSTLPRVWPDSHVYKLNVENTLVVDGKPTLIQPWVHGTKDVTVSDGRLTLSNAPGQRWNKVCFIEIAPKGELVSVRSQGSQKLKEMSIKINEQFVLWNLPSKQNITMKLINAQGKCMVKQSVHNDFAMLSLKGIAPGFYTVVLTNGKEKIVKNVTITR